PHLLDQVVDALREGRYRREGHLEPGALGRRSRRLDEMPDLAELGAEYSLLRACVLRAYTEHVSAEGGWDIPLLEEARAFDSALDEAVGEAMLRFSEARDRMLLALDRISEAAVEGGGLQAFLSQLLRVVLETSTAA